MARERRQEQLEFYSRLVAVGLALVTVVLGTHGFHTYHADNADQVTSCGQRIEPISWPESAALAVALNVFETLNYPDPVLPRRWTLSIARITGCMVPIAAVLLFFLHSGKDRIWSWWISLAWVPVDRARGAGAGGRMVRSMAAVLLWPFREILAFLHGLFLEEQFFLVCGLGWKGRELVSELATDGRRVAVIEKDPDSPFVSDVFRQRVVVFFGNATEPRMLRLARARQASEVFVVTESDETNCRIAKQILSPTDAVGIPRPAVRGGPPRLCHVHIGSPGLREYMEDSTRPRDTTGGSLPVDVPRHRVQVFSTFELTARMLFNVCPLNWHPLMQSAAGADQQPAAVHVVIMGFTEQAQAILVQALRIAHLRQGTKVRIAVLTEKAEEHRTEFFLRYPCLDPQVLARDPDLRGLMQYIYALQLDGDRLSECPVSFAELPRGDMELLAPEFWNSRLLPGSLLNVFCCIDDGMRSAEYAVRLVKPLQSLCGGNRRDSHPTAYPKMVIHWNYPGEIKPEEILGAGSKVKSVLISEDGARTADEAADAGAPGAARGRPGGDPDDAPPVLFVGHFNSFLTTPAHQAIRECGNEALAQALGQAYCGNFKDIPAPSNPSGASGWLGSARDNWRVSMSFWQKESNRQAADHFLVRLISIGVPFQYASGGVLELSEIDLERAATELDQSQALLADLAEMEHRRWCMERLMGGWRPVILKPGEEWVGETKADYQARKLHPDLCSFTELRNITPGRDEKQKDYEQVHAMVPLIRIVRGPVNG